MEPIVTINNYPIGWEWLDNVPLEDFNWLIEIFATMTDNTDTYDFVFYEDSETLPGHLKRKNKIYHLTATNPNNIHHSPDNIIPHIKVPGINTGYLPHTPTQKIKQNHTNANYVI